MWHITRAPATPERSAAAIARFSGSSPLVPTTSSVSRTLMPSSTSGFSASILAAASTRAWSMFSISPTGKPDRPIEEMCRKAKMRVRDEAMPKCLKAEKLPAPASPALT